MKINNPSKEKNMIEVITKSYRDGFYLTIVATCSIHERLADYVTHYVQNFSPCGYGTTATWNGLNEVVIERSLSCN